MPPKKRTRDVDDEELDKEEVKGMLRQSLDERAELVVEIEELKKKVAEHEKEKDRQLIEKAQLFAAEHPNGGKTQFVYYRNPHLLRQATAANMKSVLDIQGCSGTLGGKEQLLFLKAESCQELIQIFENGIPVGTQLEMEGHFDHFTVLFSVAVITHKNSSSTVEEGEQSTYLPVSARSWWTRFNYPLACHLEQSAPFPQELYPRKYLHLQCERYWSQEVQDAAQGVAYNAVIDNVWVPTPGKENNALKYKLDLNKMVAIPYEGTEGIIIGFTRDTLTNGTKFQPGGRGSGFVG